MFVYVGSLPQIEMVDPLGGDPVIQVRRTDLDVLVVRGDIEIISRPNNIDFDFRLGKGEAGA